MILLANKDEWESWKKANTFPGDTADEPFEFPCFVTTEVQHWTREEEKAIYYYRDTLEDMLKEIDGI